MSHKEKAIELYQNRYNCAQSVCCAFDDVTKLDPQVSMKISSGFGGGIGGMKETCGVLTGAILALNASCGFTNTSDQEEKDALMAAVKSFAEEFKAEYGSCLCKELKDTAQKEGFLGDYADDAFFQSKPCAVYVAAAAEMLEKYLKC